MNTEMRAKKKCLSLESKYILLSLLFKASIINLNDFFFISFFKTDEEHNENETGMKFMLLKLRPKPNAKDKNSFKMAQLASPISIPCDL